MTTTLHELVEAKTPDPKGDWGKIGRIMDSNSYRNPFTGQTQVVPVVIGVDMAKDKDRSVVPIELLPGGMGRVITIDERAHGDDV